MCTNKKDNDFSVADVCFSLSYYAFLSFFFVYLTKQGFDDNTFQ